MYVLDMGTDEKDKMERKMDFKIKELNSNGYSIADFGIGDVIINSEILAMGYIVYY